MRIRLFLHLISLEARKAMGYRAAWWFTTILQLVAALCVNYFTWIAVFSSQDKAEIGGFTLDEMIMYYVLMILSAKIVIGTEMGLGIANEIYDGSLTRYLIYPTHYLSYKYAQNLGALLPQGIQLVIFFTLFLTLSSHGSALDLSMLSILQGLVALMLASFLYYCISIPVLAVAFWADNVWSLTVMLRFVGGFLGGMMVPLSLFPHWAQQSLEFTPFRYVFAFPVQCLLGRVSTQEWLSGISLMSVWILIMIPIVKLVWNRAQRSFTGVGI